VTIAVLAAIIEISLPTFGVIFVSLAAMGGVLAAFFDFGAPVQIVAFIIVLGVSLSLLRPRIIASLGVTPGVPSRTEALLGAKGVVTQDIDPMVGAGRVNVGGQDWAARSVKPLSSGTTVRVVGADGIVLEVTPA
jgi:membrane protein implicated in regulation of membrane protease activity